MKTYIKNLSFLAVFGLLTFTSCKEEQKKDLADVKIIPGIILENMDPSVSPQDDFYNYVNGNWVKNTAIPEDETRWGGFGVLRKQTRRDVLDIVNTSKELGTYAQGTDQKKALLIFETELDSVARDEAGVKPLQPFLDQINSINSISDMQTVMATSIGVSSPYTNLGSYTNMTNSSMNMAWVTDSGLGLQREYYLLEDEKSIQIRQQYVDHVSRMLQFINYDEALANITAKKILALETQLAEPRLDKVAFRDARNYFNPMSLAELQALTQVFDWNKFIKDLGITKTLTTVNVMQPKYMTALNDFLESTSIEDIKVLMTWSTLNNAAGYLTTEIEKENWDFYSKTLNGAKVMQPAEERALGTVTGSVGEAIGQLYVEAKFPPEAKAKAEEMIANARTNNSATNINYAVWDAQTVGDNPEWRETFDKVVSFLALMWIPDQLKALRGILTCLKPGGEALFISVNRDVVLKEGMQFLQSHPTWKDYLKV